MAKSKLKPQDVKKAQFGPRELKDPRSKEYAIQTIFALKTYVQSKVADEERITRELEEIRKYRHWEVLGYSGMDELLKAEVNKTEAEIHAVLKEAKEAGPLLPEKHAGPGRGKKTDSVTTGLDRGSTYLARRLLRDRPDLFERLEAGEFASVRAAALEAGIVKPTFTCPIEPERAARLIRKHFEPSAVDSLIDALQGKDTP